MLNGMRSMAEAVGDDAAHGEEGEDDETRRCDDDDRDSYHEGGDGVEATW